MTKKGEFEIPVEGPETPAADETSPAPEPPGPPPVDIGPAETEEPEAPRDDLDQLRRLQAEFVNFRRRVDRERLETAAWAQGVLVEKLLPILDDFDRALAAVEGDESPAAQGMALIREKLYRTLTEAGLERIETEGAPFDPDRHEALMTQAVEPERVNTVVGELTPGFLFKGRLVRPAQVQVGVDAD